MSTDTVAGGHEHQVITTTTVQGVINGRATNQAVILGPSTEGDGLAVVAIGHQDQLLVGNIAVVEGGVGIINDDTNRIRGARL